MLQTSQDLMFIVISFCILLFTIFIIWFLYYLIMIVRDVKRVVDNVQEKIEKTGKILELLKSKIENSSAYFVIFAKAVKEITKYVMEKKRKKK